MRPRDKTIRSVFIVTVFSIAGKLTGFFREAVIASYYGAGGITDAYFVAYSLPSILFSIIGASMGLVFVPIYTQQLKKNPEKSHVLASNIINMAFLVGLIFAGLGSAFSRQIIAVIAPRLSGYNMVMAARLARIMFPAFIFISISYIVTGVLQSHESFAIPSLVSIPSNLIIALGAILFSNVYGIHVLAWATLAGGASQLAIQLPALAKKLKYKPWVSLKEPTSLAYWKLVVPSIFGSAIDKINILVDNALASFLLAGSISAINYSTKLVDFADNIAIGAIVAVVYPRLAGMNSKEDLGKLGNTAHKAIVGITQIVLPIIAITMIFSKEIVRSVFERGAFLESDTKLTAYALSYYALGMWGIGIRGILNRVFYSLGNTSTPMKISIITLISNIVLNIAFVRYMGVGGLGLATSISCTMGVVVLFILIRKSVGTLNVGGLIREGLKMLLITLGMAYGIIKYQAPQVFGNPHLDLVLKIGKGLLFYIILSWVVGAGLIREGRHHKRHKNINVPGDIFLRKSLKALDKMVSRLISHVIYYARGKIDKDLLKGRISFQLAGVNPSDIWIIQESIMPTNTLIIKLGVHPLEYGLICKIPLTAGAKNKLEANYNSLMELCDRNHDLIPRPMGRVSIGEYEGFVETLVEGCNAYDMFLSGEADGDGLLSLSKEALIDIRANTFNWGGPYPTVSSRVLFRLLADAFISYMPYNIPYDISQIFHDIHVIWNDKELRCGLAHGDFWIGNIIISPGDNPRIQGVIDWDRLEHSIPVLFDEMHLEISYLGLNENQPVGHEIIKCIRDRRYQFEDAMIYWLLFIIKSEEKDSRTLKSRRWLQGNVYDVLDFLERLLEWFHLFTDK